MCEINAFIVDFVFNDDDLFQLNSPQTTLTSNVGIPFYLVQQNNIRNTHSIDFNHIFNHLLMYFVISVLMNGGKSSQGGTTIPTRVYTGRSGCNKYLAHLNDRK